MNYAVNAIELDQRIVMVPLHSSQR